MGTPRRGMKRVWLPKITMAPVVALATTLVVSGLGIHGLLTSADALQSALRSDASAQELQAIAAGVEDINGNLYHALTLRGAQTKDFDAHARLRQLLAESNRVAGLLRAWRDLRATSAQRPRVTALIGFLDRYKGAVDFISQMLDVDFAAAVSFAAPFDQNFHDLTESVQALVHEVQGRQQKDATRALTTAAATIHAFEAVVAGAVLLALAAAANMGWATVRSNRLSRQNSVLTRLTQIDALTGLGNRRRFDAALAAALADCTARQVPLTVILFDLDHFKKFNDSQGHQAGDDCLRKVAAVVAPCLRGASDVAARYGGEEFAMILPNATLEAGQMVAERVRQAVSNCAIDHPAAGPPGHVTITQGVASLVPTASVTAAALIEAADQGLYAANRAGRNRVGHPTPVVAQKAMTLA